MHVITRKRLNEFAAAHPDTQSALQQWYQRIKGESFQNFARLREVFPTADQAGKLTVFNIGGNKVRFIAAIHYNRQKIYIRAVLTHITAIMMKASGRSNHMAMESAVQQAEAGWSSVQQILYVPHTEADYERLVQVLDQLIDQVGEDESHPLASMMEVIGVLIERYEDENVLEIIDQQHDAQTAQK